MSNGRRVYTLATAVVFFLLFSLGVYFGARINDKIRDEKPLGFYEKPIAYIIQSFGVLFSLVDDPGKITSLSRASQFPDAPDIPFGFIGEKEINAPFYYLYGTFLENQTEYQINLHGLKENKTLFRCTLSQKTLKKFLKENSQYFQAIDFDDYRFSLPPACPIITAYGDIVFRLEYPELAVCVDKQGKILWVSEIACHHSIESGPDSALWICSREGQSEDFCNEKHKILFDEFAKIDAKTGKALERYSIRKLTVGKADLGFVSKRQTRPPGIFDPYHLNDVLPVHKDSKLGYWSRGDVFVSSLNFGVFLYRPSCDSVLWRRDFPFQYQHDVNIVNDSVISVFNNKKGFPYNYDFENARFEPPQSQIIFYDFSKNAWKEAFPKVVAENKINSPSQGRAKYFEDEGFLYVESTDQGFATFYDAQKDASYNICLPGPSSQKVGHLRWNRLMTAEQVQKSFLSLFFP